MRASDVSDLKLTTVVIPQMGSSGNTIFLSCVNKKQQVFILLLHVYTLISEAVCDKNVSTE